MKSIKLYGYATSPFVRKVACCLHYKKLSFDFVPVNPTKPTQIAFTRQTQVPVLQIGEEWHLDSTPLAGWLDELYPERSLFGESREEREKILRLDQWVTDGLIRSGFRTVQEAKMSAKFRCFGWRMAAIVDSQTPLSSEIRAAWPELLQMQPFVEHMLKGMDTSEPLQAMKARIAMELLHHFDGGPYFGGLTKPSLVDLSIYPQIVFGTCVGLEKQPEIAKVPMMKRWLRAMKAHLPANPLLLAEHMMVKPLPS